MKSVAWILLLVAAPLAVADAQSLQEKDFYGNWRAVQGTLAGDALPMTYLQSISLTIDKSGYRVKSGDTLDLGEIRYQFEQSPVQMDLVGKEGPTKGLTLLAIAKLEGDTLTVAYDLDVLDGKGKRPQDFVSDRDANRNLLITYQRVK